MVIGFAAYLDGGFVQRLKKPINKEGLRKNSRIRQSPLDVADEEIHVYAVREHDEGQLVVVLLQCRVVVIIREIDGDDNGSPIADMGIDEYMPEGIMVEILVALEGMGRPNPAGWEIPMEVGFYEEASPVSWLLNPGSAMYYFSGTATFVSTVQGDRAMLLVGPIMSGTYDITADISSTLMNVKRSASIQ